MSETLEQTCRRDPKWAAEELERLRAALAKAAPRERQLIIMQLRMGVPLENFPANVMHREAAKVIADWLEGKRR